MKALFLILALSFLLVGCVQSAATKELDIAAQLLTSMGIEQDINNRIDTIKLETEKQLNAQLLKGELTKECKALGMASSQYIAEKTNYESLSPKLIEFLVTEFTQTELQDLNFIYGPIARLEDSKIAELPVEDIMRIQRISKTPKLASFAKNPAGLQAEYKRLITMTKNSFDDDYPNLLVGRFAELSKACSMSHD